MSYNGSGTFQINTSGQPVVAGTVISSTAFNALTADLATGLSTAITKDGQTTTTARIPFAAGINSSLATDSTSTATGSIITAGGVGIAKALYVGTTANVAGAVTLQSTLGVTGVATFSAAPIYSSLTASSAVATDASKALVSVTNTGTGNNVLATSPTITTPTISQLSSASATALTLQSAGTTAVTIDTSQNVGIGTISPTQKLSIGFADASSGFLEFRSSSYAKLAQIEGVDDNAGGNGHLSFYTRNVGTIAEQARIDTSGNLLVGVTSANANGGVLQLKSGITFPATQSASSDVKTLDDYEEGTFTPTFNTDGTASVVSASTASGSYTKIGRIINFIIHLAGTTVTSVGTGNMVIAGLPFGVAGDYATFPVGFVTGFTSNQPFMALGRPTLSSMWIYLRLTANGAPSNMGAAEAKTGMEIYVSGTYQTGT